MVLRLFSTKKDAHFLSLFYYWRRLCFHSVRRLCESCHATVRHSLCKHCLHNDPHHRPIIGILTLPNDIKASLGHSYFAASYVKW